MTRRQVLLSLGGLGTASFAFSRGAVSDLIGKAAPPLGLADWLNSPPLEIVNLRGKVVLLRWWTDGCPYCAATAPALRTLDTAYRAKGLQVIGVYHPKPAGQGDMRTVRQAVAEKQFTFPVALDRNWTALKRWWLFQERDFTSVSFLLDKQGVIRYVHPGGEFHEGDEGGMSSHAACQRDFADIRHQVNALLVA